MECIKLSIVWLEAYFFTAENLTYSRDNKGGKIKKIHSDEFSSMLEAKNLRLLVRPISTSKLCTQTN